MILLVSPETVSKVMDDLNFHLEPVKYSDSKTAKELNKYFLQNLKTENPHLYDNLVANLVATARNLDLESANFLAIGFLLAYNAIKMQNETSKKGIFYCFCCAQEVPIDDDCCPVCKLVL